MKDWIYNEFKHVGVDYSKSDYAGVYDDQMKSFRDYEAEAKEFIKKLGVANNEMLSGESLAKPVVTNSETLTVVDIGCGTGAFAIHAAKYLKKIYAVDVSDEMLKIAKSKAKMNAIKNIEFCQSGALQFRLAREVDVVFSKWAFHHLPDYWKQVALLNFNKLLKINGILLLADWVFRFDSDYEAYMESIFGNLSNHFDNDFVDEAKLHVKEEFSTFDWILRGMIERAGFFIEKMDAEDPLASEFLCRKIKSF